MVGANAATNSGLVAELRHGMVERSILRFRERLARTRAEELARITWTEEEWSLDAALGRNACEVGLTPIRWVRLT